MIPKASLWGWLTSEGRLKNQWARAVEDPDPARSLNRLREVQKKLQENPREFVHLWMPFLETFLDLSRVRALTDSDLTALEQMGDALSDHPEAEIRPEEVWLRVVEVYDARGEERQARTLLTRIYNVPSTSSQVKTRCARDLARRGARGDDQLSTYVDHLKRVAEPAKETDVLNRLASICAVDFDSDKVRLRRAGEVARRLVEGKIQVPGVQTALGLHALLVEQMPSEAVKHFEAAFRAYPDDKMALVGLLAARVQKGEYSKVVGTAKRTRYSADLIVTGLVSLSATLRWLDSYETAGPPPASVQSLESLGLRKYAGDTLDAAIGRLYLLEGNARRAAEVLGPLADRHPERPDWSYYAAWAAALTGDGEGVARRFAALDKWSGRWTVACLLLDTDPALAERHKVYAHLSQVPKAYTSIVATRLALARSTQPGQLDWKLNPRSTLAENLEALRTVLGHALYTRDRSAMTQWIATPLFRRLSLADRIMWGGLHSLLSGDNAQGRALLEEAAVKFGYQRAALALSVHLLEQNQVSQAKQLLDRAAAGLRDTKIELLRAYIDACEGRTDAAARRLDSLVSRGNPRAHYALGNLYLHRADDAKRVGQSDRTQLYREQARGAFSTALKAGRESVPRDCDVLARCAEFVARPDRGLESWAELWHKAERLDASRRRPWLVWNAILAQLWCGNPSRAAAACGEAVALLESADGLQDSALVAVAQAVAHACTKAGDVDQTDKMVTLLGYLSASSGQEAVKRFYRLGISAAARVRYTKAGMKQRDQARKQVARLAKADPRNGSLALLLAHVNLEGLDLDGAAAAVREAQPEDHFEQRLCICFVDFLRGRTPTLEALPQPPPDAAPKVVQACNLLGAAAAFAAGTLDHGYEAVLAAMHGQSVNLMDIVDINRFLPALCVRSTRGGAVPLPLVEAVRNMSRISGDGKRAATVARCAAAIGEIEHACRLWERILATDNNPDSPLRREYTEFLCHLAVVAHNSGNPLGAAQKLQAAARFSGCPKTTS